MSLIMKAGSPSKTVHFSTTIEPQGVVCGMGRTPLNLAWTTDRIAANCGQCAFVLTARERNKTGADIYFGSAARK